MQHFSDWLSATSDTTCIAREEVKYLDNRSDLLNIGYVKDPSMAKIMDALKRLVEWVCLLRCKLSRLSKRPQKANSDHEMGSNSENDAENERTISGPLLRTGKMDRFIHI